MITVVGIGADGWAGLAPGSRAAIGAADVLVGSPRQLDLVPPSVEPGEVAPDGSVSGVEPLSADNGWTPGDVFPGDGPSDQAPAADASPCRGAEGDAFPTRGAGPLAGQGPLPGR